MKYFITNIALFFMAAFIFSCSKSGDKGIENSTNQEVIAKKEIIKISKSQFMGEKMQLSKIQKKSFPKGINTSGMIDVPPDSKAIISAFTSGYIKTTPLLIGDKVKKGQALVTMESMEFVQLQQDFLEVFEQLTYLESEYERQKQLFTENISSQKNYLNAESNYNKTKASYNGLSKKLQLLNGNPENVKKGIISSEFTIYAPINGSVADVKVNTGTFISPADPIMEIINTDHIHVEIKVFEKDILNLKIGQKVIFKIPEYSGEIFEGEVHLIGKSIDESRTVPVHVHMKDEKNHNFIVGMFVEAAIVIDEFMANALPDEAVIEADNKYYVLYLESETNENYTFSKKECTIGEVYGGFTQILTANGLKENDQFLVGGFNLITEE